MGSETARRMGKSQSQEARLARLQDSYNGSEVALLDFVFNSLF